MSVFRIIRGKEISSASFIVYTVGYLMIAVFLWAAYYFYDEIGAQKILERGELFYFSIFSFLPYFYLTVRYVFGGNIHLLARFFSITTLLVLIMSLIISLWVFWSGVFVFIMSTYSKFMGSSSYSNYDGSLLATLIIFTNTALVGAITTIAYTGHIVYTGKGFDKIEESS